MAQGKPDAGTQDSVPLTRHEIRTKATRDTLLNAARQVLRKRGYASATVAEIAKKARRAHGTFYLYFPNKESVYAVLLEEMWDDLKAQGRSIWHADEPVQSIIATIRRFIESYEENLDLWELAEDMSATNPHFRKLRIEHHELLARKIRNGIDGSRGNADLAGLDSEVLGSVLASMLEAACRVNFREGPRCDIDVLTTHIATVWVRALGYPASVPVAAVPSALAAS
jgi:AcrR family transcriptional regulator